MMRTAHPTKLTPRWSNGRLPARRASSKTRSRTFHHREHNGYR